VLDGQINGVAFHRYVADVLAPTLNKGDIIDRDNLGGHKG
jgi:hypothetical protein